MIKLTTSLKSISISLFAFLLILQSCSIEKRHYRPGYNIEWKHASPPKVIETVQPNDEEVVDNSYTSAAKNDSHQDIVEAILKNKEVRLNNISTIQSYVKRSQDGDGCDRIYLLNGKIIKSRISSHKDSILRYVYCDSVGGKEFTLNKKLVKAVKFANGKYEVLNNVKHKNEEKFFQEDPDKIVNEEVKAKNKEEQDIANNEKPKKTSKNPRVDAAISILLSVLSIPFLYLVLLSLSGWFLSVGLGVFLSILYFAMLFFAVRLAKKSQSGLAAVFAGLAIIWPVIFFILLAMW